MNVEGIHSFKVEGVGYDFIPKNCDNLIPDKWYKHHDQEAFTYSRRLIREEGLLVGGSSGAALWAAIKYAKENNLSADKRIVCVFVDSVRNYMTKFLNDDWMLENGFLAQEEYDKLNTNKYGSNKVYGEEAKIHDLGLRVVPHVTLKSKVGEVLKLMKDHSTEYVSLK